MLFPNANFSYLDISYLKVSVHVRLYVRSGLRFEIPLAERMFTAFRQMMRGSNEDDEGLE